jgi:hypothetical protein
MLVFQFGNEKDFFISVERSTPKLQPTSPDVGCSNQDSPPRRHRCSAPVLTAPPLRFRSVTPADIRSCMGAASRRMRADAASPRPPAAQCRPLPPAGLLPILVGRSSSRVRRFLRTNRVFVGLSVSGGEIAD